jgi:hypothetical protein
MNGSVSCFYVCAVKIIIHLKPNSMNKVVAIFRAPDMSKEQYDKVMTDLERVGMYKVKNRSHHCMALQDNGSVVVDVWESADALNEFFGTLGPILVKNGVTPPQPELYPVHNVVS